MEKYEINKHVNTFSKKIEELKEALDFDTLNKEILKLTKKTLEEGFWDDQKQSQDTFSRLNTLNEKKKQYDLLNSKYEDLLVLVEMIEEDNSFLDELENSINELDKEINDFQIIILLSEEYDDSNAILELHPGAGGTESMDWCEMLYRMYLRYADKMNYKVEVIDYLAGDEAGIKSVTIQVKGKNAYGYLKAERGVHRLVRISPFDANKRRHTSFVSCDVAPEIDEKDDIQINDDDIKIDVYRSSGAGGQSVNTTDSAVRITHKPTGIVVTCQNERSQLKNKDVALKVLKSKLLQEKLRIREEEMQKLKGEHKEIGWGSQIRSYVFHPYSLVKDHRTNYEIGNIDAVMDGNIMEFINAYLRQKVNKFEN